MMHPEAAAGGGGGGGRGIQPELNSAEEAAWTYSKALQDWSRSTLKVGNNTNFGAGSAAAVLAASSIPIVAETGATEEVLQNRVHSLVSGRNTDSTASGASDAEVVELQQQQPLRKKAKAMSGASGNNRWVNHKKETCKCAVCMQLRGELKSSWYKHNQSNCACAVCRQSRGESKNKGRVGGLGGGGGRRSICEKPSTPSVHAKRASWMSLPESSIECWACSMESSLCGGSQLQKPYSFASSHQSGNNFLKSRLGTPPVRPESCTVSGIPIPWQQKLASLAKERTDCSSVRGIPPSSSSLLDAIPKCSSEETCERLTCQQRSGCSYHVDNMDVDDHGLPTNLFSNTRCSGWPNAARAHSTDFTGSNSDGVQHSTSDCLNMRRSCGHRAVTSYNGSSGLSWQNTMNKRQDATGTSTGLHNAESLLFETKKLNLQLGHSWESVNETSPLNERDGHWRTYPNLGSLTKIEPNAAGVLTDPFLSLGQSSSKGGYSSSMALVQPDAASSHSTMFPELDFKPVYVPFQSSNSPHALSGRCSSVAQFPFGLEVQAEAQLDMYQPGSDLQAPIQPQSMSFNFDEGTTESSSPPCETTSTTSVLNERDNCSPVMDIDSGDVAGSSSAILHGSLEKEMARTDLDAGAQAKDQPLQSRVEKRGRRAKPVRLSKRLASPDDSHFTVHQKRAKREGVPKWCQLIQSKYDYVTIVRKIYTRSRVRKRCPESPLSAVLEPSEKNEKNEKNEKGARDEFIPARREAFVAPKEKCEDVSGSMNEECNRESLNSKKCLETSLAIEAEDSPRDMKIRKLNCYGKMPERLGLQCAASPVQCHDNIVEEFEAREVEMPSSLSEKGTSLIDLSDIDRKIKRSDISSIDDHSGNIEQLADRLIQAVLAKLSHGSQGGKRPRTGVETCSELRHTRLDLLGHLIPHSTDIHLLPPLKKHCAHQGPSAGTSAVCTDVEPKLKLDLARTKSLNSNPLKLTIEVFLPESLKVYYLTRILKARTPELTVWSIDLVRCMAHQCPSIFMVQSHALVPKEHTSLCQGPLVCPAPLYLLHRALKRYFGPKISRPSNIEDGKGVDPSGSQLETSSEIMIVGTRPKLDEELLSRFWHVFNAENGFLLLPQDRLPIYAEDLLRQKPFDRMIDGASRSLSMLRKYCVYSLLCDVGLIVDTKFKPEKMTAFEEHTQSPVPEKFIPMRNLLFPYWIDKPLDCIRVSCVVILKRSPPRLLSSSDAADTCFTSKEDGLAESQCKQSTEFSTGENLEDDLEAERMQIYSDGVAPETYASPPRTVVQTTVCNLTGNEHTPGPSAIHGECIASSPVVPTEFSAGEDLEDDLEAERMQIYSDGVAPETYASPPRTVVQTTVCDLTGNEHTPGPSAIHGECIASSPVVPTEFSAGEDLEDDLEAERMQIYSDGVAPEACISPPRTVVQTTVCDLTGNEHTPGPSATHGECIASSPVVPTEFSAGENLEDDLEAEKIQIYSDGVVPEACTSPPGNVVQTTVYNLMGNEHTPGPFSILGECITSTEAGSPQTPPTFSFRDLLNKLTRVDNVAPPPLSTNSESGTNPRQKRQQNSSSECSKCIPDLDVWERHSDLRGDGPISAALTNSCDSISPSAPRRGCPKGGWPKKDLRPPAAKKTRVAKMSPMERDKYPLRSVCRMVADVESARGGITNRARAEDLTPEKEIDIEVIHPANIISSKKRDSEFNMKLKTFLDRPFQLQELRELEGHAFLRKPLLRLRETRHRVLHVATTRVGMSYLDHHPDLARKVGDAAAPEERLRILRGFFFWLQHSCISGSFKPWAPDVDEAEEIDDDCVEIPKERFENCGHHGAPEAKAKVGPTAYQHHQTKVGENNAILGTPRKQGWKRKAASQPSKSDHVSKQSKPSMHARVKRERN
ncbi:unnamed protein product [Calypogeia fissa]